ncbi:HNRNPK [Symbiodinium sp. CCMP2592]|nr:HNRNPK [Symbiodinium sp. CCMP2592]
MRDDDITTTVSCPVRRVGALIGKAGATIIQLRKETGASIEVERSDGKEPREVTISGSDSAVKDAVQRFFINSNGALGFNVVI